MGIRLSAAPPRLALLLASVGLLAAGGLGGCAGMGPGPEPKRADVIDIGLRRGSSWTTFGLKRNKLMGSTVSLELKRGEIYGFLDGNSVRLKVTNEEISGYAGRPNGRVSELAGSGRVQIDIEEVNGKLMIEGTWSDNRVRFEITPEDLRGTVQSALLGQCQFVLDKFTPETGERSGTSICSGMPEETRLIFPKEIESWLTRGEAVAVLLALLASSPPTSTD